MTAVVDDAAGLDHDEPVRRLQRDLELAAGATVNAYQETTRLIRLLMALGHPAAPDELVSRTLTVLSEVYFADVTCLAHLHGPRLLVTGSCGLPEDDPAFRRGWPIGVAARQALRTARVVTRTGALDAREIPSWVAGLGIHSAAWVPLSGGSEATELLILFRRSDQEFTPTDVQVMTSVAARLRLAMDERERNAAIERLAQCGHLLARHLEVEPLLEEAADVLRHVTGADRTAVVTLDGDTASLRAQRGLPPHALPGTSLPVAGLREWYAATHRPDAPLPATVLTVPVSDGRGPAAVLLASRDAPGRFSSNAWEAATILANYVGVALANAGLHRALRQRATHDPLTGLANRTLAQQYIEDALSRREASHVGLLFCDLDRFKAINDRLGHEAGDELLQMVAHRLRRCMGPRHLLARFGGDEFVVGIDGVRGLTEVAAMGERVTAALEQGFELRGEQVRVSVSVGGVLGVRGRATASAMLRDADAAMYVAKDKGAGRMEIFDDAAANRSLDRLDLRSELPHALDRGQLSVRYQPIFRLDSGEILAFEALLRWTHPRHGAVAPDVFIPLAEQSGAIVPIGCWVLEQACRQLADWKRLPQGYGLAISVNLSALQLRPHLVAETLAVIQDTGVDPADVWLEITEHSYVSEEVSEYATALHLEGVRFSLDDFGTAYSNLSYLKQFPIDTLKIDRSFIAGLAGTNRDPGVVHAILAIADSLGLAAIAEGVESDDQREALLRLGCRIGQGNLMAPALPPAEATALLRDRAVRVA